jgi:hypothetical protein
MKKNIFKISFYCCIADAIICLPFCIIGIIQGLGKLNKFQETGMNLMNIIYTSIFIVIALGLKNIMEVFFKTPKYNKLIYIMIFTSALSIPLLLITSVFPEYKNIFGIILILLSIVMFIPYFILFVKSRKNDNVLQPEWKRFSTINIWVGICFLTILLIPIGLILNIISSIIGAFVFKKALKLNTLT